MLHLYRSISILALNIDLKWRSIKDNNEGKTEKNALGISVYLKLNTHWINDDLYCLHIISGVYIRRTVVIS
jgi:hypothetical protein